MAIVAVTCGIVLVATPAGRWPSHLARATGHLAWYFLVAVVLIGAWSRLSRRAALTGLVRYRRDLGLATLLPMGAHVGFLLWSTPRLRAGVLEPVGDLPGILAAGIVLILAATSWPGAQRRLGPRRWKTLHRFVVLAFALTAPAALGAEGRIPGGIALVVVLVALGTRIVDLHRRRARVARSPAAPPGAR